MSSGPSLYRRHRPRSFADVVGQEHVVRTLSHAVERGKVHHAYLFVGSRGTGKTSMAKILASCLNCVNGPTVAPCGTCDSCVSIASATSLDVIEMDAASNNSVDDIRELREKVAYAPVSGRHKVYILDEAHMLSSQAWNAFLKTLEEPPPRTIFVLATTEAQKVLATVVDRCHRFDFGRPAAEQVAEVLRRVAGKEAIDIDPGAVALIARHATGSFRDALGTLEQLLAYTGEDARIEPADVLAVLGVADAEQLFAALDAVIARDPAAALAAASALAAAGRDPGQVLRDLEVHARELLTVQVLGSVPAELAVTPDRDARLTEQARALADTDAVRLLDLVSAALAATANGAQPRIQLELVLVRTAAPEFDPSQAALLSRLERLEQGGVTRALARPAPASGALVEPAPASGALVEPAPASGALAEPAPRAAPAPPTLTIAPEPATPDPAAALTVATSRAPAALEPDTSGPTPPEPDGHAPPAAAGPAKAEGFEEPAPAPVPAAEPPRPAAGQPVSELEQIRQLWPAVVEIIRGQNAMIASLLHDARPLRISASELALGLPADAAFRKRKVEQANHARLVADAVRNVTGVGLVLRFELLDAARAAEAAPVPDAKLSDDELVRRFVEEFDAEELDMHETESQETS